MQKFENLTIEVKGKTIVITIQDYTKESGTSASGKSRTVASTRGNATIDGADQLVIGLNAYRKV